MTEGPTTNGTRDGFRQLEFGLATVKSQVDFGIGPGASLSSRMLTERTILS
jgi:hypothetical protein